MHLLQYQAEQQVHFNKRFTICTTDVFPSLELSQDTHNSLQSLQKTVEKAANVAEEAPNSLLELKNKFGQLFAQKKQIISQELDSINEYFLSLKVRQQRQQLQMQAAAAAIPGAGIAAPPLNVEALLSQRVQQAAQTIREHLTQLNKCVLYYNNLVFFVLTTSRAVNWLSESKPAKDKFL